MKRAQTAAFLAPASKVVPPHSGESGNDEHLQSAY